jgi:Sensors of blue-light using FAD
MEIIQLVYRSRPNLDAIGTSRLAAFREIHATAQTANTRNGVTGFLVFTKEHFVQILEGERAPVNNTYDRIKRDRRHKELVVVDIMPVRTRVFKNWAMGAASDDILTREAMLRAGFEGNADFGRMTARQIVTVLAEIAGVKTVVAA